MGYWRQPGVTWGISGPLWVRAWAWATIGLVGIGLLGLFAALMVAQSADDARGCGSIDPTDPANYSVVKIVNDQPMSVQVDQCRGGYCRPDEASRTLSPGGAETVDVACGVSGASMTSYRVSADGRTLGYIAVATPGKHDGLKYLVSKASPTRSTPTPSS